MAPSPTIPTSFVPKAPVKTAARFTRTGGNIFMMLALVILGVAIVSAAGVFLYQQYLKGVTASKAKQVADAQAAVDASTVEDFVHFRDRFTAAELILNRHVAASHFFDLLEGVTLANVRFNSLTFQHTADGSAKIALSGVARSFNALAAQSSAFTAEKRVKRAIFADIKVDPGGAVTFTLTAELDPSLIAFTLPDGSSSAPQGGGASVPVPSAPGTTSAPSAPPAGASSTPSTSL